ncbi:MAG TPA: hypothetical protein VGD99_20800 [Anaerolineae bacterium]
MGLRRIVIVGVLFGLVTVSGCTLASPFDQLLASAIELTPMIATNTPRPTFTLTPLATPTPTKTATPTITPIPTETLTPLPPTSTPTSPPTETPTITPTSPPPPPTNTPGPTDTPAPSWEFQLAELFSAPTNANILSIITAVQTSSGGWIPGLRVVGVDPNGLVTKSEPSADHMTGNTPADAEVVKSGNTKFEPQPVAVYITGTWTFHLETIDGRQVSPDFSVTMDEANREWYFFRFVPN